MTNSSQILEIDLEIDRMSNVAEPSVGLARPFAAAMPARRTLAVLAGSLFIAACAHVAAPLPFTPVPITLQPFAVLLVGLVMGPSLGAAACAAYLLEGAAGFPVFTPTGPGGLLQLLGPTGGYLLSYPAAAALAGLLTRVGGRRTAGGAFAGAFAANLLILVSGASWLAMVTHQAAPVVLHAAVLPFVVGDAVKVVLAAGLASAWYRTRFDRTHNRAAQG